MTLRPISRRLSLGFVCLLAMALSPFSKAAGIPAESRQKASDLFTQLKAAGDDFDARKKIVEEMIDLGRPVTEVIYKTILAQWKPLDQQYREAFAAQAGLLAGQKQTQETRREAEKLAAQVRALREVGNLTKEMIEEKGTPAMARLRELSKVERKEVLAASEDLQKLRAKVAGLGGEILLCEDALVILDYEGAGYTEKKLEEFEDTAAGNAIEMDRKDRAVLVANEKIAQSKEVPPAEAEGIRDLNEMRILIGLAPVALDPLLCEASRNHSGDMKEKGFFAHDSPVKGRETPWARAKEVGTSASAENIYVGNADPHEANKAWFYSPGHHKNMFGNHRRGGMGLAGSHWTQLFGG